MSDNDFAWKVDRCQNCLESDCNCEFKKVICTICPNETYKENAFECINCGIFVCHEHKSYLTNDRCAKCYVAEGNMIFETIDCDKNPFAKEQCYICNSKDTEFSCESCAVATCYEHRTFIMNGLSIVCARCYVETGNELFNGLTKACCSDE